MTYEQLLSTIEQEAAQAVDHARAHGGRSQAISAVADTVWKYVERYPHLFPPDQDEHIEGATIIQRLLAHHGLAEAHTH
ncbi:MAG: hypothetical protein Fur005_36450 [Roseiflexaceae bacterium]